jgi:DNA-binding IclR family transcriptional regulator
VPGRRRTGCWCAEAHGLVARTADGAFRLGSRLAELAARADPGCSLGAAADRVMR